MAIHLAIIIRGVMMERLRHTIFVHVAVWNEETKIILKKHKQLCVKINDRYDRRRKAKY